MEDVLLKHGMLVVKWLRTPTLWMDGPYLEDGIPFRIHGQSKGLPAIYKYCYILRGWEVTRAINHLLNGMILQVWGPMKVILTNGDLDAIAQSKNFDHNFTIGWVDVY